MIYTANVTSSFAVWSMQCVLHGTTDTARISCSWFFHGYNLIHVQTCLMTSFIHFSWQMCWQGSKEENCFPKSEI